MSESEEDRAAAADIVEAIRVINESKDPRLVPPLLFAGGDVVNAALGVTTYDPAKAYVVDSDGIREMTDDDRI